ncbi:Sensory transduction protein regX3 [Paraburkholderia aspalathi]|uniref:Sensory transduction protein regX3 n=2 Tax=Paraburkholderia aspalathi TaxID=1324617 RepID=A0ABM8RRE5_9BURK|nr:Sensory transduction protein regX3 [Paraburkholderia aspalathi]
MKIALCPEQGTLTRKAAEYLPSGVEHYQFFMTPASLFRALKEFHWDLVIVGWNFRDLRGSDLMRWFRATFPELPRIIFVTKNQEAESIIGALDGGAIDYIFAPIPSAVLRARLDAISRRFQLQTPQKVGPSASESPQSTLQFGLYVFHQRHHFVDIRDKRIVLRPKEYALALLLFKNRGRAISREVLHEALWGNLDNFPTRTLDTHLSRLRAKLNIVKDNGFEIKQIRGVGYRMDAC